MLKEEISCEWVGGLCAYWADNTQLSLSSLVSNFLHVTFEPNQKCSKEHLCAERESLGTRLHTLSLSLPLSLSL